MILPLLLAAYSRAADPNLPPSEASLPAIRQPKLRDPSDPSFPLAEGTGLGSPNFQLDPAVEQNDVPPLEEGDPKPESELLANATDPNDETGAQPKYPLPVPDDSEIDEDTAATNTSSSCPPLRIELAKIPDGVVTLGEGAELWLGLHQFPCPKPYLHGNIYVSCASNQYVEPGSVPDPGNATKGLEAELVNETCDWAPSHELFAALDLERPDHINYAKGERDRVAQETRSLMTDIPNMHDVKTQIDANVRAMTQKLQAQRELQETAKADWKRFEETQHHRDNDLKTTDLDIAAMKRNETDLNALIGQEKKATEPLVDKSGLSAEERNQYDRDRRALSKKTHKDIDKLRVMKNKEIERQHLRNGDLLSLFSYMGQRRALEEQVIASHIEAEHDEHLLKLFKVLDDSVNSLYNQTAARHDMLRLIGDNMNGILKKALQKAIFMGGLK